MLLRDFKKMDWVLLGAAFLLVVMGLISIYSSSQEDFLNFRKQIIFLVIAISLMFLVSFVDWREFRQDSYLILTFYFLCIISLIGLFFFSPEIRGVRSWYKIGDISIDPIEFTKIVLIILLAKYFSMRHIEMYRIKHIILSGFYVFIPCVLIFFQPDLGSSLILIALWVGILVISGIKLSHFVILAFCGLLIFSLCWSFLLKDYQKERVSNFIVPQTDPLGAGWNRMQSKIAIGSGGIFGQGVGKGSQTQYGFLPEPQTDFIFASIAEEMGLSGVVVLFSLFLVVIWRIVSLALTAQENFLRLFASGLAITLISGFFINIGMNLGILPIIGISLPLVSYGGSGLVSIFLAIGIIQSIRIH